MRGPYLIKNHVLLHFEYNLLNITTKYEKIFYYNFHFIYSWNITS